MKSHGLEMYGDLKTNNIKAQDGTSSITISDTTGMFTTNAVLYIGSDLRTNNVKSATGNSAITIDDTGDVTTNEILTIGSDLRTNNVKSATGNSAITIDDTGNITVNGELKTDDIKALDGTSSITISNVTGNVNLSSKLVTNSIVSIDNTSTITLGSSEASIGGSLKVGSDFKTSNIKSSTGNTALSIDNTGNITVSNNLKTNNVKTATGNSAISISDAGKVSISSFQFTGGTPAIGKTIESDGSGNCSWGYGSIPSGEILMFEKNTAVVGYTLKTDVDDSVVYITKGSAAGGEFGGTVKSGGTWTQPSHTHTGPSHRHIIPTHTHNIENHRHTTGDCTLTVSQMPSHRHTLVGNNRGTYMGQLTAPGLYQDDAEYTATDPDSCGYAGGNSPHNHGYTGYSTGTTTTSEVGYSSYDGDYQTSESGTSTTGSSATLNTWRPKGINFTRQQRT